MSVALHKWKLRWIGRPVAWDSEDGKHRNCGRVAGPGLLTDTEGTPTTGTIELHPTKSDPHPDGRNTTLETRQLAPAAGMWEERYIPPRAAVQLFGAIHSQAGVTEKKAAIRGFLTTLVPGHEVPVDARVILTCREGDTVPDGHGGTTKVDDENANVSKLGDYITVLLSQRAFEFVREQAILSGIFEKVQNWEAMMKEATK